MSEPTDAEVLASRSDAGMMERPHLWPHLLLPLKKRGTTETAVLYPSQDNDGKFIVVEGVTIYGPTGAEAVTTEYDSAQAVVDAGWVVD